MKEKDLVLNLTQHKATPDQLEAGVIEPEQDDKRRIRELLTFEHIPTPSEMHRRAAELIRLVREKYPAVRLVMLGGAPYFMPVLTTVFEEAGYTVLFAFSKRVVEEVQKSNGAVEKRSIFRFEGFVRPF